MNNIKQSTETHENRPASGPPYDIEAHDDQRHEPTHSATSYLIATAHHDPKRAVHLALLAIAACVADQRAKIDAADRLLVAIRHRLQGESAQDNDLIASASNDMKIFYSPEFYAATFVADALDTATAGDAVATAATLAEVVDLLGVSDAGTVQVLEKQLAETLHEHVDPKVLGEIDAFLAGDGAGVHASALDSPHTIHGRG